MGRIKGTPPSNALKLEGQRFGLLVVLKRIGTHKKKSYWLCKCDCGNEVNRRSDSLKKSKLVSCGCAMKMPRISPEESGLNQVLDTYRYNSKRKGLSFNLSREQFKFLISDVCYYCGEKPSMVSKNNKGHAYLVYNGIDRLDNNFGYVSDNVVTCCSDCNYLKNKRNFVDFMNKISKIYKHRVVRK